jgi:prophage maintenance system killer protein
MATELFLLVNGHELVAGDQELEALVLSVARGELGAEAISIWLRQRLRAREP